MRPSLRFGPVKEREQQAMPALPGSASSAHRVAQRCGASLNRRWTRLRPSCAPLRQGQTAKPEHGQVSHNPWIPIGGRPAPGGIPGGMRCARPHVMLLRISRIYLTASILAGFCAPGCWRTSLMPTPA
jgi:hypothetical protein